MIKNTNRRQFVKITAAGTLGVMLPGTVVYAGSGNLAVPPAETALPLVISTWNHGLPANEEAWKILSTSGRAVDAVEKAVMVSEADPGITSVGYGGFPDRDGRVTLDACIMDETGKAGSVSCLEHILHPVSVARLVMDQTPHVMLVGDGALQFALENGFTKQDLLTDVAKKEWEKWKINSKYEPKINVERHDTIATLAMDKQGNLAGACTTSGLAFKMHGRVGDSPIIGAGLYVDNEVGAAGATGLGETVLRTCASFLIVELMRQGYTPYEACREAAIRVLQKNKNIETNDFQVGFIAVNKAGQTGAFSIHPGFNYALCQKDQNLLIDSEHL